MIRTAIAAFAASTMLAGAALSSNHDAEMNIVETAQEAGSFSTLLAAAEAAGLVETLTGEGPFTVFAPTDEAFAALPEGTVDSLLLEENREQLTQILTLHVVPQQAMAADLSDGMTVTTVEGSDLTIQIDGDTVQVDDATVVTADVAASNGVIHVIDSVILPQGT